MTAYACWRDALDRGEEPEITGEVLAGMILWDTTTEGNMDHYMIRERLEWVIKEARNAILSALSETQPEAQSEMVS